jgi:hypothetical protein
MDSGGGDIHAADHGAAWFLRDAPVFYCIQVAPDFGMPPETIHQKVRENFDRWLTYIQERLPNAFDLHPSEGQFRLPLASKFIQSECNAQTPLVFYFEIENERVTQTLQHFDQPIAFSFREAYNPASGRAQGFVWFHKNGLVIEDPASNSQRTLRWERNSNLDLMILHELGHIFGNPHLAE